MNKPTFFHRLTDLYLGYLLTALLIFPGFGGYASITTQKSLAFLLPSTAYLLICVIGRLELALVGGPPLPKPSVLWRQLHLSQKLVFGLWLLTALSMVFTVDPATAFWGASHREGFWTLSLYYGCFLLISRLTSPKPWHLAFFAAAMSVNCLVAMLQLAGYNPLTLYPAGTTYYSAGKAYVGRLLGTVGSLTLQGAVLSLIIPALVTALLKGVGKRRFFLLIPLTLCLYLLWMIRIDAALVGVLGGILLTLPLLPRSKPWRIRLSLVLALLVLAALILVYCCGSAMPGFLAEVSAVLHGQWEDDFGSGRGYIWRRVLELIPERPLLGGGPDTLGIRLDTYYRYYNKRFDTTIRLLLDMAHNEYLNLAVNQGLPALALYLAALFSAAGSWIRHAHEDPALAVCGSAALGYCIQAFFGLSTPFTTSYLWLVLALLVSTTGPRSNKKGGSL